jgi:peptidoglycan/LPS O-acetylase OafA/YrhL
MSPVNAFPVIVVLAFALLTVKAISLFSGSKPVDVKYTTIDGLRGYLAFFVFIHHAAVWYFFLKTQGWNVPPSNLFIHFGQTSVALFFMITGFLFFSKINNGKGKQVDWLQLFVSRVFRLVPLYILSMVVLVLIIAIVSNFHLNESAFRVFKEIAGWSLFTVYGAPLINNIEYTTMISAGVVWSLVYEWVFYLSLPIIGLLFFRKKVSYITLLITSGIIISIILRIDLTLIHFYTFGGGIAASFLVRWEKFCNIIKGKVFSILAIICLILAVYFYRSPQAIVPLLLLSISFIIIACGNTLFGILTLPVSRLLGQMAYSIYLLQGLFLFICFRFIVGYQIASKVSVEVYWLLISAFIIVFLIICSITYKYIELPAMRKGRKLIINN